MFYQVFSKPVKLPIALPASRLHQIEEHLPMLLVVGLLEEVESAYRLQILGELVRIALTEHLDGRVPLGLTYLLVPLLERVGLQALPGQRAAQKVHEHVAEGFEVVAATLLLAQMCVDAHVARGARQRLVLPVGYVLVGLRVDVGLGQAEVNDVYNMLTACRVPADEEVLRLDVAVDQVLGMHVLHAGKQLNCDHEHGLERELAVAQVKQIFQRGTQEFENKRVVARAWSEVIDLRHAFHCCLFFFVCLFVCLFKK